MPVSKAKFSEGEKVLCYHGLLLYDAKCLKIDKEKETKYYVHYSGWSKLWDEWISESKILKNTEQNLAKQQELKRLYERGRKGLKRRGGEESAEGSRDPSRESSRERSKRRRTKYKGHNEQENMEVISIVIPEAFKLKLVHDADMIASKKLVSLPASPTVSELLDEYCEYVSKSNPASSSTGVARECAFGIKTYFNEMLGIHLLYNAERSQYDKMIAKKDGVQESDVYGAEHLLRLFVKIGDYLVHMLLESEDALLLTNQLEEFLRFLEENEGKFFNAQYSSGI